MRAWKGGHKGACQWLAEQKAEVQAVTGDPREWGRFTRWLEFHRVPAPLVGTGRLLHIFLMIEHRGDAALVE